MTLPTRSQFYSTVFKQCFILPDSIIYYISKNPISPKCHEKMVQTCKYFFIQNSIIVVELFSCDFEGEIFVNWEPKSFDSKNIYTNKLWVTVSLSCGPVKGLSFLLSKIYRFDGKALFLWDQTISYDELLLLSSKIEKLRLKKFTVKYKNGSIVPFEKFFESFPKIKLIDYFNSTLSSISFQTFKELEKMPHFLTLEYCYLGGIPEDFDIESFYNYIKRRTSTNIWLRFCDPLSEAYENGLEEIIDEIIEGESRDYKPPMILFNELNEEKRDKLYKIYHRFFNRFK